MNTPVLFLLTLFCGTISAQKLPASAITSIMQEILSQGNPDQAVQLIKGATKKIGMPEFTVSRRSVIQEAGPPRSIQIPVNRRPAVVETNLPRTVARNEAFPKTVLVQKGNEMVFPKNVVVKQGKEFTAPTKFVVQKPNELLLPKNVLQKGSSNKIVVQKSNEFIIPISIPMQKGKEMVSGNKILLKKPELVMPNKVVMKNSEPPMANRKILVQKANEIPVVKNLMMTGNALPGNRLAAQTVVVQKNNMTPQIRTVSEINVMPEGLKPRMVDYVTREKVVSTNPFLPAASPVSALTAAAPAPNAVPQSRGQFLRKIPIPPPTI